ncbi:DUF1269 domain-containing protein [Actinomadura verrucosospora]|uniref:Membrane protein n=1 Tax=Actinomadura verrucosospora TaxID=46165 RepID=A0A7D3ZWY1_ACTVE|nr:DUF1269 domain-containing protein [Actinomadura verrucosospora]QKG21406.1 membrane protein [Actinomadura verrucosospora]
MSDLIAVAYPDVDTAVTVRDRLIDMQRRKLITLGDAAVVEKRPDGKIKLHQIHSTTRSGALWGGVWGGLLGMLFFAPLVGAAVGAAAGAAGGSMTDVGVDDSFMRDVGEKLRPGGAVLFLLVISVTPDRVIPQIAEYGGEVMQTSLSNEAEANLREALKAAQHAQPAGASPH